MHSADNVPIGSLRKCLRIQVLDPRDVTAATLCVDPDRGLLLPHQVETNFLDTEVITSYNIPVRHPQRLPNRDSRSSSNNSHRFSNT